MHFSNFDQEKFSYKKKIANNNNDSRINEMLYRSKVRSSQKLLKLEAVELLMVKKGLDLTYSVA